MWSMCSIDTGHASTHAPQVTQSQIICSGTPLPTIGSALCAKHLVAHAHDQELRREDLPGRVRRARVLAAAALGAREAVHHLLLREVEDRRDAEAQLLLRHVEAQRLEPARARACAPATRSPPRSRCAGASSTAGSARKPSTNARCAQTKTRSACPARERLCELRRQRADVVVQPRGVRAACQQSSVATTPAIMKRMKSASPRCEPWNRGGRTTLRITTRRHDAGEHEHDEQVDEPAEPRLAPEPRQLRALVDRGDHRHHDRREQNEEAPEDERVHQPRHEPLQQLALAEHDLDLVLDPPRHVRRAVVRLRAADLLASRN